MRIAHIVASLEARYGGPSRSVRFLAEAQANTGDEVEVFTTAPVATADEVVGTLRIRTAARGRPGAICPSSALAAQLRQSPAAVIHNHGLWLRTLHYAHRKSRRDGIPLVIAPRGMMGAWAWQHRRLRKAFAARFIHPGALDGAAGWHATSASEAEEIRGLGFKQPVCVAPNGVSAPSAGELTAARTRWEEILPACRERRVAVFYSRFHPKKRVLELIDLWQSVAPPGWLLLLVGMPEHYQVAELRAYAAKAGAAHVHVHDGAQLPAPYAIASLFVLPSHTENFGLAIAEALAHGLPALVTDTTPWRELGAQNAGWCVPWNTFEAHLRLATTTSAETLAQRGAAGRAWVLREFSWEKSARTLADFYATLPRSR